MERISTHQFMTLSASVLMGGTFLLIASFVTKSGGRDGWMTILPAFALTIPYGLMVLSLSVKYPQENLLLITEKLLGKGIGKTLGFIYCSISGFYGGLLLAFIGVIYEQSIMPLVPRWVFYLGGLFLVFHLVSCGVEVFARFSEIILPLIVIAIILNTALTIPRIEQGELLPILSDGIKPLFFGMFRAVPFSMVYILFLAGIIKFLPIHQQEHRQLTKGVWRAALLVGTLNMLVVLTQILVFGPSETDRLSFGILELGKMVEISRTVAGVESLFMGVWLGALVMKCCAYFFMTTWGLESVFKLKGKLWRLFVGVITLGITFLFKRGYELSKYLSFVESYVIFPFAFLWIPTLYAVSLWKVKLHTPDETR